MFNLFRPFMALPGNGIGGLVVLLLYAIQSEIRFGTKARAMSAGPADRGSTLAVSRPGGHLATAARRRMVTRTRR
jgi:hypothetical protein